MCKKAFNFDRLQISPGKHPYSGKLVKYSTCTVVNLCKQAGVTGHN